MLYPELQNVSDVKQAILRRRRFVVQGITDSRVLYHSVILDFIRLLLAKLCIKAYYEQSLYSGHHFFINCYKTISQLQLCYRTFTSSIKEQENQFAISLLENLLS